VELERVFHYYRRYDMKILLDVFSAKLGREDGKPQVDYVLINNGRHASISGVRSFRGADCDSNLCLVVANI
jgi:hypothetical protein